MEVLGQLSAACVTDAQGTVLRVTIEPGRFARLLQLALRSEHPGWGLHVMDVSLTQGNILDVIAAQSAAWSAGHMVR